MLGMDRNEGGKRTNVFQKDTCVIPSRIVKRMHQMKH